MADLRKFLDQAGLEFLWGKVKEADDALAAKIGEVPEDQTVMDIITNIQENAYDDTELKAEINAELAKKADKTQVATDIENAVKDKADKTQVATDIAAAVGVEKAAREAAVITLENAIALKADQTALDALAGTHATDKAALEAAIALKADKTALDEVSAVANAAVKQSDYDKKIADLEAADVALDGRLDKVEAFFDPKDSEGNPVDIDAALDTLVEIQQYINTHGTAAEQIVKDVAQNKADIATKADATEVNNALAEKVDKVEGKGLSTNDLTDELKAQYDAAQANVIETVQINGEALTPENKTVNVKVNAADSSVTVSTEGFDTTETAVLTTLSVNDASILTLRAITNHEIEAIINKVAAQ